MHPRPMVRAGRHYIPMPRRRSDMSEVLAEAAGEMSENVPAVGAAEPDDIVAAA